MQSVENDRDSSKTSLNVSALASSGPNECKHVMESAQVTLAGTVTPPPQNQQQIILEATWHLGTFLDPLSSWNVVSGVFDWQE